MPGGKMAKSFPALCSLFFFILTHSVLSSGPRHWWPPNGIIKFSLQNQGVILNALTFHNFKVKCPYKKVDLSWFRGTANPCPGVYQPICGTNFVTYENPCMLCVESLKSQGKIRFLHDGKC